MPPLLPIPLMLWDLLHPMPTIGSGMWQLGPLACTVSATPDQQSPSSLLAGYREQPSVGALEAGQGTRPTCQRLPCWERVCPLHT